MPSEYEALVAALQATEIPFAENGWKTRPVGMYGVVSLDFEAESCGGDDLKQDTKWEASVDVFFPRARDRRTAASTVQGVLSQICGGTWGLNSFQYETETQLFHMEWTCEVMDTAPDGSDTDTQGSDDGADDGNSSGGEG